MSTPDFTDTDKAALTAVLKKETIAADRFPFSPRVRQLRAILEKLGAVASATATIPGTEAGRHAKPIAAEEARAALRDTNRKMTSLIAGMLRRFSAFAVAACVVSFGAHDADTAVFQYEIGTKLLSECQSQNPSVYLQCLSYIEGVSDALLEASPAVAAPCYPGRNGVQPEQLQRVVLHFLQTHPERLHESAAILVQQALIGAFPCRAGP